MKASALSKFAMLSIILSLGLGIIIASAYRADIAANWEQRKCEPGVMAIAGAFKPNTDPRTRGEFAEDNWKECQKEYIQAALREAARAPQELATAASGVVGVVEKIGDLMGDVFIDLWKFVYEAYSTFMDTMKGAAKLFQNFMVRTYDIVQQLQASIVAIFFGLYSMIVAFVNSVQLILIVAIVIIGIMIALEIILFFIFPPIFGIVATLVALVSVVAVAVATAIGAAMVAEMFVPGACFAEHTMVVAHDGSPIPIQNVRVGLPLRDGGRVVAVHEFQSMESVWDLFGIHVTGDHLVQHPETPERMIPVRDHPAAKELPSNKSFLGFPTSQKLWCLTTTTRRIPVLSSISEITIFADWEEIPDGDDVRQRAWFKEVWVTLNGENAPAPPSSLPTGEAGLSPDCRVGYVDWIGRTLWKPISDVQIGDTVVCRDGAHTKVVGKVTMGGDQSTDAVNLAQLGTPMQLVAAATWVQRYDSVWAPAAATKLRTEIHPARWEHLYTASGEFMLEGGWVVRDFSDVGLSNLRPLVEDIVLS
jgi:hypothetical protein